MRGRFLVTVVVLDDGHTELLAQCPEGTDPRDVPALLRLVLRAVFEEWRGALKTRIHRRG